MSNRFLTSGGTSDFTNGTAVIFAGTLGAANFDPDSPVRVNASRQLVTEQLPITDIIDLQATLDAKVIDVTTLATGQSLIKSSAGPHPVLKGILAGTGITLASGVDDVTINATTGATTTLTSAGGTSLVTDGTGPTLEIKGITAGTGITLSPAATFVTINNAATLQSVYDVSSNPEIVTDNTRLALSVRCGSSLNTDNVFEGKNIANALTSSIDGSGLLNCTDARVNSTTIHLGANAGVIQGSGCVAIGNTAGNSQGTGAVAIGSNAGKSSGSDCVAIGRSAGQTLQGVNGIAIGADCGVTSQGINAISIGNTSGQSNQGQRAIAIGLSAQTTGAGTDAIAIGANAGVTNQHANSIIISSNSGTPINSTNNNQLKIAAGTSALTYDALGLNVALTVPSTSATTGSINTPGGVGIGQDIRIGGSMNNLTIWGGKVCMISDVAYLNITTPSNVFAGTMASYNIGGVSTVSTTTFPANALIAGAYYELVFSGRLTIKNAASLNLSFQDSLGNVFGSGSATASADVSTKSKFSCSSKFTIRTLGVGGTMMVICDIGWVTPTTGDIGGFVGVTNNGLQSTVDTTIAHTIQFMVSFSNNNALNAIDIGQAVIHRIF